MPKKKYVLFICIIILFFLGENYFIPEKIKEFQLISDEINKVKDTDFSEKENALKDAYGYDDYLGFNVEYSKVLFRDIYRFNKEITIYKGKAQNIKENNLVVNKDGLVGIVTNTNENSSQVQLLYNENTSLSVKINDSYGILKSQDNSLMVEGINNKSNIQIGDIVTTSDLSIYPEKVLIGKVSDISYDTYEIEQILTIEPFVDFNSISYVGVLTDLRGVE